MTIKRDARGTLRDYARESEGELLSVFPSFFNSPKVFSMAFPTTSVIEPNCDSPWRCFAPFDKTYSSHSTFAVPTTKCFRIMAVFFWRDKTKILSSIIEPISIDMVNKSPTVFWFSYNVVMDKIAPKSSIAIVASVHFYPLKFRLPNVAVYFSKCHKLMAVVIKRSFNIFFMDNSIRNNAFSIDWHERNIGTTLFSIIFYGVFSTLGGVFVCHRSIIPRVIKFHKEEVYG